MNTFLGWAGAALVVLGTVSITLGTIGLLRFPDALSRLHALTKADSVGLGLCVLGLVLIDREPTTAVIMLLIWVGVMLCGATTSNLVASRYLDRADRS